MAACIGEAPRRIPVKLPSCADPRHSCPVLGVACCLACPKHEDCHRAERCLKLTLFNSGVITCMKMGATA